MGVTMQEVAQHASVSIATVSRVLSDPNKVNDETLKRVREAIKELGYRVNTTARSLRTSKSLNIALVVATLKETHIVEAIEAAAFEQNYTLMLCTTRNEKKRVQRYIDLLTQHGRVDGICWAAPLSVENLSLFRANEIPLVVIDERLLASGTSVDEVGGAAVSKLLQMIDGDVQPQVAEIAFS